MDDEEQLQTRVAWYYYVGNLTQQQIANRMGTSRVRINRLLAASRESGIVQISINSKLAECVELEQQLVQCYGLHAAVVVPTPDDEELVTEAIGVGAGGYLDDAIHDGQTVAIGWGRTLAYTLRALSARAYRSMSVVSLQGGLSHCARLNTFEIVSDFATRLGADCYYFAAPIYASSEAARDTLLQQEAIRETYERARNADLAIVTLGDMTRSLIVNYGVRRAKDVVAVQRVGAVGDMLGQFIDADGCLVDHELNRRTVAVSLDDLRSIDEVVLASGGQHKFEVTRAAVRGGYANVLVTDEATARRLVDESDGASHVSRKASAR